MSEWISVEDVYPNEGDEVLLYWKHSNHIEDGAFYIDEDTENRYHALFDGSCLNCEPTHWMPLPEPPK